jgi:hypothetical protein
MEPVVPNTWLGVVSAIVGIVLLVLGRLFLRQDKSEKEDERRQDAMNKAAKDWRIALRNKDSIAAEEASERYKHLKNGGKLIAACLAASLISGCTSPRPFMLSEHVMFPESGTVVPPLPKGQSHWLLATVPLGVETILPVDFPRVSVEPEK